MTMTMKIMRMSIMTMILIVMMIILSNKLFAPQKGRRRVMSAIASINSNHCPPSLSTRATTRATTSWSNLIELERYNSTSSSSSSLLCKLVPANRTATFLWNAAATRIVEWTSHALLLNSNSQLRQQLEQELVHMIRHDWGPRQMRRSIKGYPKSNVWNGLLNKIHQRLLYVKDSDNNDNDTTTTTTIPPPVVYILTLTPRLENEMDVVVAPWQDVLQNILNQVFIQQDNNDDNNNNDNWNKKKKKKLIFQIQVQAHSTAFTTQVYTESMRYGLFHIHHPIINSNMNYSTNSHSRGQPPDLILHAMGHADMMMMHYDHEHDDILQTVNFTDNLRHALQHFIRASTVLREGEQCQQQQQQQRQEPILPSPPAVLFVNDYYNHRQEYYHHHDHDDNDHHNVGGTTNGKDYLFLKQVIYSRVVQQLVDHYQLGYISHSASGIQRQEWIKTATRSATGATTAFLGEEPRQVDDSKTNSQVDNVTILTDQAKHSIQILWTLLFSMLQYTIDECSNRADQSTSTTSTAKTSPLVSAELLHRIENIIPPYLDGELSLQNVSPLWKQQEDLQRHHAAAAHCPALTDIREQGDASLTSGDGSSTSGNTPLCPLALGPPVTAVEWRRKLTSVLPSSSLKQRRRLQQQDVSNTTTLTSATLSDVIIAPGWKVLDKGILRATDYGAHLTLHVPLFEQQQQKDRQQKDEHHQQQHQQRMRAILFVVHQTIAVPSTPIPSSAANVAPTILEWSIQMENNKTPLTRQVNATTYHVDDSNSRPTPVALPHIIEWTHATTTTTTTTTMMSDTRDIIKVDLRLLPQEGTSQTTPPMVDIVAFFICRVLD